MLADLMLLYICSGLSLDHDFHEEVKASKIDYDYDYDYDCIQGLG